MKRFCTLLPAGLGVIFYLGCAAEPLPGGTTVSWGLIEATTPNAEWVRIPTDDALLLHRYYRSSLLGKFKLYFARVGLDEERVIRAAGTEAPFLATAADLMREQIDKLSPRATLEEKQPTLYSEPYLAVQFTYHEETNGERQFHLDRLYFVENRYWFLDAGCLAEEEGLIRPEIEALVSSLVFPRFAEAIEDSPESADGELTDEELESMEEISTGWNL
jgi:hypothetical protein